jgi:hypothetical protein
MQDEIIGMLGFDVEFSEDIRRKICQVAGHDNAGAAADRGRQHMSGSKDRYSRKLFEQARYFGLNLSRNDHLAMLHSFIFARMMNN